MYLVKVIHLNARDERAKSRYAFIAKDVLHLYEEFEAKKADVAANAILDACTGSNPRTPSQEEMEQLLECVYTDTPVTF